MHKARQTNVFSSWEKPVQKRQAKQILKTSEGLTLCSDDFQQRQTASVQYKVRLDVTVYVSNFMPPST